MVYRQVRSSDHAVRKAWLDTSLTAREAARSVGMSYSLLRCRALALGLPRRIDLVAEAEVRRAWLDTSVPVRQAAASIGFSYEKLRRLAMAMALPPRPLGHPRGIGPGHEAEFRTMWLLGVSTRGIAAHFRCNPTTIVKTARRLGLGTRSFGFCPVMSLDEYRESRLGVMMQISAVDSAPVSKQMRPATAPLCSAADQGLDRGGRGGR